MNKENTYEMVNEILEIIGKHFFISEMDTFDRQVMSIEFSNLIKQKLNQVEQRKVEEIREMVVNYDEVYINEDVGKAIDRMKDSITDSLKTKE